mmetsp:Transcript_101415/g.327269  ORF Transcript_101415/g.327269 Transcript_101415/m.327269 type:complete len:207 (+) Transcript_101415:2193-2813(+)
MGAATDPLLGSLPSAARFQPSSMKTLWRRASPAITGSVLASTARGIFTGSSRCFSSRVSAALSCSRDRDWALRSRSHSCARRCISTTWTMCRFCAAWLVPLAAKAASPVAPTLWPLAWPWPGSSVDIRCSMKCIMRSRPLKHKRCSCCSRWSSNVPSSWLKMSSLICEMFHISASWLPRSSAFVAVSPLPAMTSAMRLMMRNPCFL